MGSLVVIVWALNGVRLSHPPYPDGEYQDEKGSWHMKKFWAWRKMAANPKVWGFRTVIVVIMAIMPLFSIVMNQGIIFLVIFLCLFALQFADIEGKNERRRAKEELKEKRMAAKEELDPKDRMHTLKKQKTVGKL